MPMSPQKREKIQVSNYHTILFGLNIARLDSISLEQKQSAQLKAKSKNKNKMIN